MGVGLSHPITNKSVHRVGSEHFKAGCVGMQGYRTEMEDAHAMVKDFEYKGRGTSLGFFAVFDGHAGDEAAKHMAIELPKFVLDAIPPLLPTLDDTSTTAAITSAVLEADRLLLEAEKTKGRHLGAFGGCTAIFAACIPISDIYSPVPMPAPPSRQPGPRLIKNQAEVKDAVVESGNSTESGNENSTTSSSPTTTTTTAATTASTEVPPVILEKLSTLALSTSMLEITKDRLAEDLMEEQGAQKINFFTLIVGNLGDSRCLLGRADGCWAALSQDHKPQNPLERARILKAGGFVEQNRVDGCLALSRALGDFVYKNESSLPINAQKVVAVPDYAIQTICTGDYLVLACDGIFDVMTNKQVMEFVHRRVLRAVKNDVLVDPVETMSGLVDACLSRGSKDNITAMMVVLGDGRGYGPATEFLPTSIPSNASDQFKECYSRNCEQHGVSVEEAQKNAKKSRS